MTAIMKYVYMYIDKTVRHLGVKFIRLSCAWDRIAVGDIRIFGSFIKVVYFVMRMCIAQGIHVNVYSAQGISGPCAMHSILFY